MNKDQLIEKPEINIVKLLQIISLTGIFVQTKCGQWISINIFRHTRKQVWMLISPYLPEIQQNLHVITKSNLESYLEMYKDDWLKVTVEELISMIKRSMEERELEFRDYSEGKPLLPDLFIDFDKEEFYSNHLGMKTTKDMCQTDGSFSGRFDHLIPKEEQYWIEETKKTEGTSLLFI